MVSTRFSPGECPKKLAWSLLFALLGVAACTPADEPEEVTQNLETAPASRVHGEPERIAPGIISTETQETFPAEDPLDGSLWFSRYERGFDDQTIWVAPRADSGWSEPRIASFSGRWGDRAPRFSADGSRLYFTSNRPARPGDTEAGDMNIWVVTRDEGGTWGEPELVPAPVSQAGVPDIHAAVVGQDVLYWASRRENGFGRSDIYRARLGSSEVEHLGEAVNDTLSQPDLLVGPDESWMILAITDHPGGQGGDDLYLSRKVNGQWTTPVNLGAVINSPDYEYGPTLSHDGRHLYFTSHRDGGNADIYRIETTFLESMK